jgi:hypothetical protein
MGRNLKNKKLIHKLTWYVLERDDIKEDLEKYDLEFQKDFQKELEFLQYKRSQEQGSETEHKEQEPAEKDNRITEEMKELHGLFRSIAKKTHPDLYGDEFVDVFKAANEAFNNKQWIDLITIAADLKIELPEFSGASTKLIEESIQDIEKNLDAWTNSVCWVWASKKTDLDTSDPNQTVRTKIKKREKANELKKTVRAMLNINEKEFEEFLNQS